MATVHCTVNTISMSYPNGTPAPVVDSVPVVKEALTSSSTAAASTVSVPVAVAGGLSFVWEITAKGGDVWVRFGATPVAAAGSDHLVIDGQTRNFAAVSGHKVSVIDA